MKKYIIGVCALTAAAALAQTEYMKVLLNSGETVQYKVTDVTKVWFEDVAEPDPEPEPDPEGFTITPKDESVSYATIPTMLRVETATAEAPVEFGFGNIATTDAETLTNGEYGVWFTIASDKAYTGEVAVSEDLTCKLIKYEGGLAESVLENPAEGYISTLKNDEGEITVAINVTYANGINLKGDWKGKTLDVTTLEPMIPVPFTITPAEGDAVVYSQVPSVLRVLPAETGDATQFGFGDLAAEDAETIPTGAYGVWISMSPSVLNTGVVNVAENAQSLSCKLIKYEDVQAVEILENPVSGTILTELNQKSGVQKIIVDVTYEDGTRLQCKWSGKPVNVETLEPMIPAKKYGNEFFVFNSSGDQTKHYEITIANGSYNWNKTKYAITFSLSDEDATPFKIEVAPALINAGEIALGENTTNYVFINEGVIQVYSGYPLDTQYKPLLTNGTLTVSMDDNGKLSVFTEFIDSTITDGNPSGTGSHVVLNYVDPDFAN